MHLPNITQRGDLGRISFVRNVAGRVETAYIRPQYGMQVRRRWGDRRFKIVSVDLPEGEMTVVDADRPEQDLPVARTVPISLQWTAETL